MEKVQKLFIAAITFLLSACSTLPDTTTRQPVSRHFFEAFFLEARFSLRHESGNYSGRLSWRHSLADDELLLASPLGQGIAEIRRNANGVQLRTQDGRSRTAADLPTLTQQVLGFPLPLDMLTGWVFGRSINGRIVSVDDVGRPLRLIDRGWYVGLEYDRPEPSAPPTVLIVERDSTLELRLRVDELSPLTAAEIDTKER